MSKVHAKSAVVSSSTPGVLVAITPRLVHAATSILSKPPATFAAIFNFVAASNNSSFTFSVSRQISPSLSFTRRNTSSRGGRSCFSQYSASQFSCRIVLAGSNNRCVAKIFGFTVYPQPRSGGLHTNTLAYLACNFTLRGCRKSHCNARCAFCRLLLNYAYLKRTGLQPSARCLVNTDATVFKSQSCASLGLR